MPQPTKIRPDKKKVIDDVWSDEHIKSFLATSVPTQNGKPFPGDRDFYVLLRAYQAMRIGDFERFLKFFIAAGGSVAAKNGDGQSLVKYIENHKKAEPYRKALADNVS